MSANFKFIHKIHVEDDKTIVLKKHEISDEELQCVHSEIKKSKNVRSLIKILTNDIKCRRTSRRGHYIFEDRVLGLIEESTCP